MRFYAFSKNKKPLQLISLQWFSLFFSGEGGIRTPGSLQINGFQDRRDRPLCHLSFWDCKNIKKSNRTKMIGIDFENNE
jgi:hypothetical protein